MKSHTRLITIIGLAALALSPYISGCKKGSKHSGTEGTGGEFAPGTLGLPAGTQNLGPDPMGRVWYKAADNEEPQWVYDPKDKTLYTAKKDEKSGEWLLKAKSEIIAGQLGLAADTVELGKDPNGLYWFEVPGGEKRYAYNPKNKTLYQPKKNASGNWEMGGPVNRP